MKDVAGGLLIILGIAIFIAWLRNVFNPDHTAFWFTLSFTVWFMGFAILVS